MSAFHPPTETALVAQVAKGDARAFGKLVDGYWKNVYSHALAYLKSPERAEEFTQDVFAKIWRKKEMLAEVESFKNYLFIVTRNELVSALRKKVSALPAQESLTWLNEEVRLPDANLGYKELDQVIRSGIEQLKPHQREILLLSRVEELSYQQIGARLGISHHTVRGHLVNALNQLREYMKRQPDIVLLLVFLRQFF